MSRTMRLSVQSHPPVSEQARAGARGPGGPTEPSQPRLPSSQPPKTPRALTSPAPGVGAAPMVFSIFTNMSCAETQALTLSNSRTLELSTSHDLALSHSRTLSHSHTLTLSHSRSASPSRSPSPSSTQVSLAHSALYSDRTSSQGMVLQAGMEHVLCTSCPNLAIMVHRSKSFA